jgi:hypothetical protein
VTGKKLLMRLIFVHGWSVTSTSTYGNLPKTLAEGSLESGLSIDIQHVYLGKYISFKDEVTMDDIATAFDHALRDIDGDGSIAPFSCITHSTGGPVVRHWVEKYYGRSRLDEMPLTHLVMLAPANHGSALAALGKERVGRIKAWWQGIEPGQKVLDWLCLGSQGQWELNEAFVRYRSAKDGFYPFVLTGQGIDQSLYDFLNSYLEEKGSDGVVRVSGANMNSRFLVLAQSDQPVIPGSDVLRLDYNARKPVKYPQHVPLGVFHQFSHSGTDRGIMAVKAKSNRHGIIVTEILKCLQVSDAQGYRKRGKDLVKLTQEEQAKPRREVDDHISRYSMLVLRVRDHLGDLIPCADYDIFLLGGADYQKDALPKGFFVDRQQNRQSNALIYYIDADRMLQLTGDQAFYGISVVVRPEAGFSYFRAGEFRSEGMPVDKVFSPNETTYIDITIQRYVDRNVFVFDPGSNPGGSFKGTKPSGDAIPN